MCVERKTFALTFEGVIGGGAGVIRRQGRASGAQRRRMFAISKIRVSANRHHRDTVKIGVWFSGELFADTEHSRRTE